MLDHVWIEERPRTIVLEVTDIFGINRCMFASNFPVDKLYSGHATLFEAFSLINANFSTMERERLFSRNAESLYSLT